MNRRECLEKAIECVNGQREEDYGRPEDNFGRIAELWTTYLKHRTEEMLDVIKPKDVAIMMMLLKVARLMNSDNEDSWVDIAGYSACGCEMTTGQKKEVELPEYLKMPDIDFLKPLKGYDNESS